MSPSRGCYGIDFGSHSVVRYMRLEHVLIIYMVKVQYLEYMAEGMPYNGRVNPENVGPFVLGLKKSCSQNDDR